MTARGGVPTPTELRDMGPRGVHTYGHDLRADAIDGMRRMCKQMCNMCKQNWAMWRGSNSNGHFKAEIPTSVLIELVPVGS